MDHLPPIPTPPAQRWREFRIRILPGAIFCIVTAGVVFLWRHHIVPANIVGAVEAVHANVISTIPGTLQELKVERFQMVTNGQVIGQLVTVTPEVLQASIDALIADLKVNQARMITDEDRNQIQYESVRLSLLSEKVQLAVNRVNLRQAVSDFKRAEELFRAKPIPLISEDVYDLAKSKLEALQVAVTDGSKFIDEKERTVPTLRPTTTNSLSVLTAIEAEIKKMKQINQPAVLTAPMDGMITAINVRPGEKIVAGQPLAVISGSIPRRIVAYVRQPANLRPKVGDTAQVRRTGFQGDAGVATVTVVGNHMEPVDPVLLPAANARVPEVGLQFSLSIPPGLELIPGEIVDIILRPAERKQTR